MRFFRRGETLNEKLMREAGLEAGRLDEPAEPDASPDPADPQEPPPLAGVAGWDTVRTGYLGPLAPRGYDALGSAVAPDIQGDEVKFWVLPDRSIVVDEEVGDAQLDPLADAVEHQIRPPYRAHAVREGNDVWTVTADSIEVAEFQADGDVVELARTDEGTTLTVDGAVTPGRLPALERIGETCGRTFAVHAERIDGDLWDVRAAAL